MYRSHLKNLSLESLEIQDRPFSCRRHQLNESNDSLISLEEKYETISLYDENGDGQNKRLTWEDWYQKKRIQALQENKKAHDSKPSNEKSKANARKLTQEQKEQILTEWFIEKEKNRLLKEKKILEEKALKESKKERDRFKSEQAYQEWIERKKELEKLRKREEEKKRIQAEKEAKKKAEAKQRHEEQIRKWEAEHATSANFKDRVSYAVSNGRLIPYYDRSANPEPKFINKPWVD